VKQTHYFSVNVLAKRPEIKIEWIMETLESPDARTVQPDGRLRFWRRIPAFENRALRVVTLADGETIHNAFFDRDYKGD